jgi:hypothetical protein
MEEPFADPRNPAAMTPHKRRQEIAVILARGVLRLRQTGQACPGSLSSRDREANARNPRVGIKPSRPTLHGLASHYPHVTGVAVRCVEAELAKACSALG